METRLMTIPWRGWILAVFCANDVVLIASVLFDNNRNEGPPSSR